MSMDTDWRYYDEQMEVRSSVLSLLLKRYGGDINEDGSPTNSTESIYACAHDWVSHGNRRTDGIIKYYEAYYKDQ